MSRWIAFFDDQPAMLAIRAEREALHLTYLAQNASTIRLAGGLREHPDSPFVGGLWVLEAATREDAVRLIENDPYYEPSVRRYRLLSWGNALPHRVITDAPSTSDPV